MPSIALTPWIAAGLVLFWVVAYWCYTLLGATALADPIRRRRRLGVAFGVVGSFLSVGAAAYAEFPLTASMVSAPVVAFGLSAYAMQRQWLFPRPATRLTQGAFPLTDDALVAVLPGGSAVAVAWLTRLRTAVTDQWLVVHCGLARSLAVFERPAEGPVGATLPHASGFEIGTLGWGRVRRWDGVDGLALDRGANLRRAPVALMTHGAWRARFPDAPLLRPEGRDAPPAAREIVPKVPAARGIVRPMDWGVLRGQWEPVDVTVAPPWSGQAEGPAVTYLSRWAALARGWELGL